MWVPTVAEAGSKACFFLIWFPLCWHSRKTLSQCGNQKTLNQSKCLISLDSWTHRITQFGSHLWRSPTPTSCSVEAQLELAAQCRLNFWCLQGWMFHYLSKQLIPIFDHCHSKIISPHIKQEFPKFLIGSVSFHPVHPGQMHTGAHRCVHPGTFECLRQGLALSSKYLSIRHFQTAVKSWVIYSPGWKNPSSVSFPISRAPAPDYLGGLPIALLQPVKAFFVLWSLES